MRRSAAIALALLCAACDERQGEPLDELELGHALKVSLPARADEPFRLLEPGGVGVAVSLLGASEARGEVDGARRRFRDALDGADLWLVVGPSGVEDHVVFQRAPRRAEVAYRLELSEGVAGLRLVAGSLELLDASGAPRLRAAPPFVVDALGDRHPARFEIEGCAVDRSPAAPWERPVTAPGARSCVLKARWRAAGLLYPAALDPVWTTTGSLLTARHAHAAAVLKDGKVLIVGGEDGAGGRLASAELFNPSTLTFASTDSLSMERSRHTATVMGDGQVLVVGGINASNSVVFRAEVYDPMTGQFTNTRDSMSRASHAAVALPGGDVLAIGGEGQQPTGVEQYSYIDGGWVSRPSLSFARIGHTATVLLDGGVLVIGGANALGTKHATAELLASSGSWTSAGSMATARSRHTATRLPDGSVLVIGGQGAGGGPTNGVERYTGAWTAATQVPQARYDHTATLLPNGMVLVVGGYTGSQPLANGVIYDPSANDWEYGSFLPAGVYSHTASAMLDGSVLIAGGLPITSAARLHRLGVLGDACGVGRECSSGHCVDGVCCNSACTEQCRSCATGQCLRATGSPVGTRPKCAGDGGTCSGSCTGSSDVCVYPTSSCRAASCSSGMAVLAESCDGAGSCPAPRTQACAPYACGPTGCRATCAVDGDCTPPNRCLDTQCRLAPDGGPEDGGTSDGGTSDGGAPDAGAGDAGAPDGGVSDAGESDGGDAPDGSLRRRSVMGWSCAHAQASPWWCALAPVLLALRRRAREVTPRPPAGRPSRPCRPPWRRARRPAPPWGS